MDRGLVDLGSFQELIFDHDLERVLSIRLDLQQPEHYFDTSEQYLDESDLDDEESDLDFEDFGIAPKFARKLADEAEKRRLASFPTHPEPEQSELMKGFEVSFTRPTVEDEINVGSITLYSSSGKLVVFEPVAGVSSKDFKAYVRKLANSRNRRDLARVPKGLPAKCSWVTENRQFWSTYYHQLRSKVDWLIAELRTYFRESSADRAPLSEWPDSIMQAHSFYGCEFSLDELVARFRRVEQQGIVMLDGFVPLPTPSLYCELLPEIELGQKYGGWDWVEESWDNLDMVSVGARFGRLLDDTLARLFPLGPYRKPAERWYVFEGSDPRDVGFHGESLPSLLFRNSGLVDETNNWLDKLKIGYHMKVEAVGPTSRELFEVRLTDSRRQGAVDVALSDVGFGISQILPLVVQSLAGQNRIITIEQPEVHVHPALQADLGDLLVHAIQHPKCNRFIIETHSEHLVLRMQRLIREGKLKPNDVSIVYVSRGPNGSKAETLRLDDEGDFVDEWPGGFFPERLRELR